MSAAESGPAFVYVKLSSFKEDAFAYLEIPSLHGCMVGQVACLACENFPRWGLCSGQVDTRLVEDTGTAEPTEVDIAAALALEPLAVSACVTSGAWLVITPIMPVGALSSGGSAGVVGAPSAPTHASRLELLSKLLELRLAELEQRRLEFAELGRESAELTLESAQRRLEKRLRSVLVQRWDGPISSMVKLRTDFEHFFVVALAAVRVTWVARLYMIRGQQWAERQPLTADTYAAFLQQSRDLGTALPDIYVCEVMSGVHTSS